MSTALLPSNSVTRRNRTSQHFGRRRYWRKYYKNV